MQKGKGNHHCNLLIVYNVASSIVNSEHVSFFLILTVGLLILTVELGTIIIPTVQVKKLGYRKIKWISNVWC